LPYGQYNRGFGIDFAADTERLVVLSHFLTGEEQNEV